MELDALADRFQAAVAGRDRAAFAGCCATDLHFEDPLTAGPLRGPDALAAHCARLWEAVPDVAVATAGPRLTDGRHAALPVRVSGTQTGALGDLPPSERRVDVPAVLYVELDAARERLWRIRAFFDLYATAVTVGVLPGHGGLGERALLLVRGFGLRARDGRP